MVLSRHDVVQPDILFISKERLSIITEKNIQGAPDLIVEILSPETKKRDLVLKKALYEKHGVKEFWIVDPEGETINLHQLIRKYIPPNQDFFEKGNTAVAGASRFPAGGGRNFLPIRNEK